MGVRVLIVKVSALGDIVHALPVLDYLHQVSPGITVDWVAEERFCDVLTGNPLMGKVIPIRAKEWKKRPFAAATRHEMAHLKNELLSGNYDMAFDIQGNLKSGLITWVSGAKRRYGFDRDGVRESLNLLFTNNQVPLRRQDYHVSSRALRVVSVPFGRDYMGMTLKTDIYTSPADDAGASALLATLADGLVFLFHHGTTWETKLWYEQGWIDLGRRIQEKCRDATILLSWGGEEERLVAERIAAGIAGNTRLLPKLSLKEFTALLKKVDLVVGGDTGPVHMAAAVGTPTVSFYRVTDPRRNGPQGYAHVLVQTPLDCRACLRKKCDEDGRCRESVGVEAMMKGIEGLLGV